ncbi:dynein light chain binding protein [Aureococcus anophagefferens]|nr:dynein light chain binding protein [Aureococcus anophagefferens]
MGFAIPDAALNVTLQEDKYHSYRQNLQLKLRKYAALLASLSPMVGAARAPARRAPAGPTHGLTPLNWNSQRIPFFIEACDKALNEFAGVVEEVVATSNNGNSPLLAGYYKLWEKRIFNAITMMITKSLAAFQEMLRHEDCRAAVKNIVESAKVFVRWKRGTCLECEPQVVHEDEEPFVFSFFQDVSSNQHIVALQRSLTANIQNLTMSSGKISNYLESWTI